MDDRILRSIIIESYHNLRKTLADEQNGFQHCDKERLFAYQEALRTMEKARLLLSERERFIIDNEVFLGRKGRWYESYYSENAYRNCRRDAYRMYHHFLEL